VDYARSEVARSGETGGFTDSNGTSVCVCVGRHAGVVRPVCPVTCCVLVVFAFSSCGCCCCCCCSSSVWWCDHVPPHPMTMPRKGRCMILGKQVVRGLPLRCLYSLVVIVRNGRSITPSHTLPPFKSFSPMFPPLCLSNFVFSLFLFFSRSLNASPTPCLGTNSSVTCPNTTANRQLLHEASLHGLVRSARQEGER